MEIFLIFCSIIFGLFRPVLLFVDFNEHIVLGYQAFAHILVGLLLATWYCTKDKYAKNWFWILTTIEVVCAGISFAL